jgi:metallophosphoesterase superfamily enzyme
MKAICDTQTLTRVLLEKNNIKIKGTPKETLENHYNVTAKTTPLFMMPSFNDFLGGNPINETRSRKEPGNEELIGPVLRSEAVDVDNSEIYLTDGTYLGTLNQIRKL